MNRYSGPDRIDLANAKVVDEWAGVRSRTPDGHLIAEPTNIDGLSVIVFHFSSIQLSPAVCRVVARHLVGEEPSANAA